MEIEKLLNETNLRWAEFDDKEVSQLANDVFQSYKESLVFGNYKGKLFLTEDVSTKKASRMGVQTSDLNLFKSKLNQKLSQYMPPNKKDLSMFNMAKKISNKLSQLRSNFLFKASRMKGQSKINFKRKNSLVSEVNFSKYKKNTMESSSNNLVKKTTFGKTKETFADQSSRIYSIDSIPETDPTLKTKNLLKTNEILQEMEGVEDTPKEIKATEDCVKKDAPSKTFFGKIGVFSTFQRKQTRKLKPVINDDDDEDPFHNYR